MQAIHDRGGHDNRRTMLIIMEHRNAHFGLEPVFHNKAIGGFNVLQVNRAEGGFQPTDRVSQDIRIAFVDLDVEHVDVGEGLQDLQCIG